jgi:hypothetical protein
MDKNMQFIAKKNWRLKKSVYTLKKSAFADERVKTRLYQK